MEKVFTATGVVREAYDIVRNNFWKIIGQCFLLNLVFMLLSAFSGKNFLLGILISALFAWSLIAFGLAYVEKKSFALEDITNGLSFKKFLYFFCAYILFALAVIGGFILLIIPGFIVLVQLALVKYVAVRSDLAPLETLRESTRLTKGYRWEIFGFLMLMVLINILGALCLLVGLLFTIPLTLIATTLVYVKLAERGETEGDSEVIIEAEIIEVIETE